MDINNSEYSLYSYLLLSNPEKYMYQELRTFDDLRNYYHLFNQIDFSKKLVAHVTDIIVSDYKVAKRKRISDSIKIMYRVLRNCDEELDKRTVDELFFLFSEFLAKTRKNSGKIYKFISGRVLTENQIRWLVNNSNNEYALNRILRYPEYSEIIAAWCKKCIKKDQYVENRLSEYLGCIITSFDSFIDLVKNNHFTLETLSWSLFYSHIEIKEKEKSLLFLISKADYLCEEICKVSLRLKLSNVIEKYYEKYMCEEN